MKSKEFEQIVTEKISIFGEVLEFIDTNKIERSINKISKNLHLDGVIEEEKSVGEEEENSNTNYISFHSSQIKNARFPCYDGSFKNDISKFLKAGQNKEVNKLYEKIIQEKQKVYLAYTHIENKIYKKINEYIQFSYEKNNTPMQIVSKLKEISETLLETIKFIESYLFKNFQILQKLFSKIDMKLSDSFEVESLSLFFLLDIFDLPNNELSYILMFKIIDEESCILKYLTQILDNQVKHAKPYNNNNINDINNNTGNNNNEINTMEKDAYLLDSKSGLSSAAYNAMINIKEKYIKSINESIINIDSYSYFRAKYYNKYIYTKGNYEVDTNLFLNYINEDNDDNNEDFLPLNSLMDEEVIISKFVKKSVIKKFLKFFKSQLPKSFNRNEKLIMIHSIFNNIISVFVIYWYRNFKQGFLEVCSFYLGKLFSKMFFNLLIKKRKRLKTLLIISNIIAILSFIMSIYFIGNEYYKWIIVGSRFLIGLSYSKNIETKFIINYVPKLLIKKTIKKYFSLMLFSLSLGFFLSSGFNYAFYFIKENFINMKKTNDYNLDFNNIGEIFLCFISFILLIINCMFFKEPKYDDFTKINNNKKDLGLKNSLTSIDINNIKEKQDKKQKKDKDTTSIFSYGKAKLISFKEKNKAKLLEAKLKLDTGDKNYEGTNQIFNILQKLIIEESTSKNSYTNRATKGHILLYTLLYIISSIIIFYNPIIRFPNEEEEELILTSKNNVWIFGFSYLLAFLIYILKIIKISSDLFVWNVIILIFICFEIGLSLVFLIFDTFFFDNSPIKFNTYYFYGFLSLILFFNILIEIYTLKTLIREIPIENKISSINIDNFLDIYECLIKAATYGGLLALSTYLSGKSENELYIKIIISILYILCCIIFIYYNFKRRQIALIKIINKVTYESF